MRIVVLSLACWFVAATCQAAELDKQIQALQAVGPKGAGHRQAISAWKEIAKADVAQLTTVLAGMDQAGDLASNWFRAAAETIAQRSIKAGNGLPKSDLESFLMDTTHAPRSRRLAYELLLSVDESAKSRLIPKLNKDPSLELRRDAIAMLIERAEKQKEAGQKENARATFQAALVDARAVDQIRSIAKSLSELDVKVDLASQFGFVIKWSLIGPFDNKEGVGFDAVYPPERELKLDGGYQGVEGRVAWKSHATDDELGTVDLNTALGKHKGAVAYAYAEFNSADARACDVRIGCINGNKVWINGEEVISNRVYHAGMDIDQYSAKAKLKKGKNTILVKICQNEQTEPWAQRWQFQLRICDSLGGAILDRDRAIPKAAAAVSPQPLIVNR